MIPCVQEFGVREASLRAEMTRLREALRGNTLEGLGRSEGSVGEGEHHRLQLSLNPKDSP